MQFDFVVVGAGVAGLRAAIELAEHGTVLVLTKQALAESNTFYAQGGVAVAMAGEEDVALHLDDTLAAGDGLVTKAAAEVLVHEGPERVQELLNWDTRFDRVDGKLVPTREAAHSRPRILHANGDATGAEISRALIAHAKSIPHITLLDYAHVLSLLVSGVRVTGVLILTRDNTVHAVRARATLLASGGAGMVYSDTTNPPVATGDGIAMAYSAGAELADMEFYQFHPTALSLPGVPRFLLSEALRGEGAWLINDRGERFMERYSPMLELAPRDVVARAITREGLSGLPGESRTVYLDMRHVIGIDLTKRFPGISAFLKTQGLSLSQNLIPVRPAAHYLMGGIRTSLDARTSVPGLYAAGEAACTGVHGANRLASNSLLEGLVFGARAARAMVQEEFAGDSAVSLPFAATPPVDALRGLMWRLAGLLRDGKGLEECRRQLEQWAIQPSAVPMPGDGAGLSEADGATLRHCIEASSLLVVATAIVTSALARHESRGAHYRNDYPQRDDENFGCHSILQNGAIRYECW